MIAFAVFVGILVIGLCVVLPIIAIVRTSKVGRLERRLDGVEAALARLLEQTTALPAPKPAAAPVPAEQSVEVSPPSPPVPHPPPPPPPPRPAILRPTAPSVPWETVIGQKWLGWVAILLIFTAAAFFLKYAFENRWIGELGRVTLGVIAGLAFAWGGLERHRKGWRYLSQVLTAGGITILYLSVYGAFGYYHLVEARTAFLFLIILVAEAHLLAALYDARAIAVMAIVGGFLNPILLSTGHDQYVVLFTYIVVLDLGTLGVVLAKRWHWIGSLAYVGTQLLFWGWFDEHYHPEKRPAVLLFQSAVFVLFVLADLAPHLRKTAAGWEEWIRLAVNPFVFYAICYSLLDGDHHDWMAVLALLLGIVYALLARAELALRPSDRRMLLVTVGTALTFVTVAIPVQLESNWITIAWGMEALVLIWASFEAAAPRLRLLAGAVFALAVFRFLVHDSPWIFRAAFNPVLNRYFLGTLALSLCFAGAAYFYRRMGRADADAIRFQLIISLVAVGVLWIGTSVDAYAYFQVQSDAIDVRSPGAAETVKQLQWAGQLSLSILWSIFAGAMTAAGFRLHQKGWRVAGLVLFGITLLKVVFVDITVLEQFYRILALLALGLVLLGAAWAYQRVVRREQVR
ncbi:MAG TPA: DUF2339 domain-containing protein [Bryobacteraceae bacterium]|nr:DUF2339 domain-containing protein [Bryobacteraceae bacterium]